MPETPAPRGEAWPSLPYDAWKDTCATLHMWTQIVGKVRMTLAPPVNHWWHVPLYVTARGLTTSPMPYGDRAFEVLFNFFDHRLVILDCDGGGRAMKLEPRSVADFYREFTAHLRDLGFDVSIRTTPVEIPDPIPFERDEVHAAYDPEYAHRFWRVLVQSDRVFKAFRSGFTGKVSPVHFFWGSFDLAVTRFSGRPAPPHPGAPNVADSVTREAYSHEVSSVGWWPGGFGMDAAYYAYAYPEPEGFSTYPARPDEAFYSPEMREFFLPYEAVRAAEPPDARILDFCQSTYEAAAESANWDRAALERS
jgi:hypothetical protein